MRIIVTDPIKFTTLITFNKDIVFYIFVGYGYPQIIQFLINGIIAIAPESTGLGERKTLERSQYVLKDLNRDMGEVFLRKKNREKRKCQKLSHATIARDRNDSHLGRTGEPLL